MRLLPADALMAVQQASERVLVAAMQLLSEQAPAAVMPLPVVMLQVNLEEEMMAMAAAHLAVSVHLA